MVRFVGDVHGKFPEYIKIIEGCDESIQVGDMGLGFGARGKAEFFDSLVSEIPGDHTFIRGNHDSPKECRNSKFWVPDGAVDGDMMFIGGANSIDKHMRVEGVSWWADEELSYGQLLEIYDRYREVKPRVMVTHTAPLFVPQYLMGINMYPDQENRTEKALLNFWQAHKPEIWVFGHWHKSFDQVVDGTRFICLNELEYIDLEA